MLVQFIEMDRKRLGAGRNQDFSLRQVRFEMFVKYSDGDVN